MRLSHTLLQYYQCPFAFENIPLHPDFSFRDDNTLEGIEIHKAIEDYIVDGTESPLITPTMRVDIERFKRDAKDVLTEYRFTQEIEIEGEKHTVTGVIDAIFVYDFNIAIIDWKTFFNTRITKSIKDQIALYIWALRRSDFDFSGYPIDAYIYFTRAEELKYLDVEKIDKTVEQRLKHIFGYFEKNKGRAIAGEHCQYCPLVLQCPLFAQMPEFNKPLEDLAAEYIRLQNSMNQLEKVIQTKLRAENKNAIPIGDKFIGWKESQSLEVEPLEVYRLLKNKYENYEELIPAIFNVNRWRFKKMAREDSDLANLASYKRGTPRFGVFKNEDTDDG